MIYAGIDVNIITHERALAAGVDAMGLWLWGMCYAQLHQTDGRLAKVAVLSAFGGKKNVTLARQLVASGLWSEASDGSFAIVNYGKKNQSADEIAERVAARRASNAARQQAARDRRNARVTQSHTRDVALLVTEVTGEQSPPPPPPPPSDQIIRHSAPAEAPTTKGRGSRLARDWTPSAEAQEWAKAQGITDPLGSILDEFRDYWCPLTGAKATKLDWDATFRNRVRQVATRSRPSGFAPRGAEITKQPPAYDAPWMKLPEVG